MSENKYIEKPMWYVVHTYSGYEQKVKRDLEQTIENRGLEDYIFEIIVPMEEQITITEKGERKTSKRKVFPSYVLVKMIVTEKTWYIVRNTRGVTGFVGAGTNPIPLTTEELRKMGFDAEIKVDYEVGDTVEILHGPYQGYTGKVEEINFEKEVVKVAIQTFQRTTISEFTFAEIQKLEK